MLWWILWSVGYCGPESTLAGASTRRDIVVRVGSSSVLAGTVWMLLSVLYQAEKKKKKVLASAVGDIVVPGAL